MFRIIQANCGRSRAAVIELGVRMRDSGYMFALLQEPYVDRGGRITGLPAGMRVFSDKENKAVVVVDDPEVVCMPVSSLITEHGVCVSVSGSFGSIFLTSVYCRFSADIEPYLLYMDAVLLLASRTPVIFGLDANAVSPLWFSKLPARSQGYMNRQRGELLADWIQVSRAGVLNAYSRVYTFQSSRARSDIDVTLVSDSASTWAAYDWSVREWDLSDHSIITVVVTLDPSSTVESFAPVPSWKLQNADWRRFGDELRTASLELPLEEFRLMASDEQVSALRSLVHQVSDTVLGRKQPQARRRVGWWTAALTDARCELRRARRRLQRARRTRSDSVEDHASYFRITRKEYERMMLSAKEEDWKRFVGEHQDDPWGHVYRICRGRKKCTDLGCLRVNDQQFVTWHDCANVLLRCFFPAAERPVDVLVHDDPPPALETFEVDACIARVRSRRSPGLDGITGGMVKAAWRAIPEYMTALYSRCLADGYFPSEWKRPRVVALLKGPDKDRSDPASYRGICLLPVFGKVLEGIMVNRVKEVLTDESRWQFGFRPGRCVEDAWSHVLSSVEASSAQYVLGIFIDFKGAFDNVEWNAALRRLTDLGCREVGVWRSFFSDRKASVVSSFGEVSVDVTRGCPQGSISGPFIWNILMDVLLRRLEAHCTFSAYADDLLLLVEGNSRLQLELKGAQLMEIVGGWGIEVGVSVSATKTVTMLLKGKLSANRPPAVRFAGANLRYVEVCRYLGITVGERLSFLPHISSLRDRLAGVVGALKRVLRVDWGISPQARRRIYAGLMVPCALFGASVWYKMVMRLDCAKRLLKSCHRRILLGCLPTCRTVSTDALEVLAGAPPLDLVATRLAMQRKLRKCLPMVEGDWLHGQDVSTLSRVGRRAWLDERILREWQLRWDEGETGRVTYRFIPDVSFVFSRPDFKFSMYASFLITGHGSMNAFLQKRGLSETAECPCGHPIEDWLHILCVCPLYADVRDLTGLKIQQRPSGDWIVADTLTSPESKQLLEDFACIIFSRRRLLMDGAPQPGRPVPD